MSIESVVPSNHLILCRPLFFLPSISPSIRVFPSESLLRIRWPKYWSFSFNISPSDEYSGLISFRMDWLDLLAVQETLKSLLQHHSSKATILQCSAFFIVQLSHPCMTTGKTIALTRWTFVVLTLKNFKSLIKLSQANPNPNILCKRHQDANTCGWTAGQQHHHNSQILYVLYIYYIFEPIFYCLVNRVSPKHLAVKSA